MFELTDIGPDLNVQDSEYTRLLGYPRRHVPGGRSRELADWAKDWYAANGRPWMYARQTEPLELAGDRLRLQGVEFASKQLCHRLAASQAHTAVVATVSAGEECEKMARELWQEGKPDEYYFLEMYGSAVVEHLVTIAGGRICAWADQNGMAVLPHYSPGYAGWDISDQIKLWQLVRQEPGRDLPGDIRVLDTGMLQPKKSLLAVFGITRLWEKVRNLEPLIPCKHCSLPGCQYRRAAYRHSPPQIEEARRLQGEGRDDERQAATRSGAPKNHHAS